MNDKLLNAAKQMMAALRLVRDGAPAEWDTIMNLPVGSRLVTAWDRLKSGIKSAEECKVAVGDDGPDDSDIL